MDSVDVAYFSVFRVVMGPILSLSSVQCRYDPISLFRVVSGLILFLVCGQCRCGLFFRVQSGDGPHFAPLHSVDVPQFFPSSKLTVFVRLPFRCT